MSTLKMIIMTFWLGKCLWKYFVKVWKMICKVIRMRGVKWCGNVCVWSEVNMWELRTCVWMWIWFTNVNLFWIWICFCGCEYVLLIWSDATFDVYAMWSVAVLEGGAADRYRIGCMTCPWRTSLWRYYHDITESCPGLK